LTQFDGIVLLDKPEGPTTAKCGREIARYLGNKVGHAGTLDPLATGLVILLIGRATKISRYLSGLDKTYTGRIFLGKKTDTGDSEGKIISEKPIEISEEKIREIAPRMIGSHEQRPPAYSAVKHKGKALYKYARQGIKVEVEPRTVSVDKFRIISVDSHGIAFEAEVSKGTYIRALAERFGEIAGCGAHLSELRRTTIGSFSVENALSFEKILLLAQKCELKNESITMSEALGHLPEIAVDAEEAKRIAFGKLIDLDRIEINENGLFRITAENELIAIARKTGDSKRHYKYERVLITPEEIEN